VHSQARFAQDDMALAGSLRSESVKELALNHTFVILERSEGSDVRG
jgi:hypothetical protein